MLDYCQVARYSNLMNASTCAMRAFLRDKLMAQLFNGPRLLVTSEEVSNNEPRKLNNTTLSR